VRETPLFMCVCVCVSVNEREREETPRCDISDVKGNSGLRSKPTLTFITEAKRTGAGSFRQRQTPPIKQTEPRSFIGRRRNDKLTK
jgi:hypothetical protein